MEAWQKVYIGGNGADLFFESVHGEFSCISCHGGQSGNLTKYAAHEGLLADPSGADGNCGTCHSSIVNLTANSLHTTLNGEKELFRLRAGFAYDSDPEIEEHYNADCGKCHASCGDCHISRPESIGGGLVQGHRFLPVPNMTENCTACHGSRIGMEYKGEHEGVPADLHYESAGYYCSRCHSSDEMHGDGNLYDHRYEMPLMPQCEDCHSGASQANEYHQQHWDAMTCQSCHSQDNKSCNTCHAGGGGLQTPSYMTFKIGQNPILSDRRPQEYVVLRHIPIAEETFDAWGISSLADYISRPTWKYTSPHNIRRWTARTDTTGGRACLEACHFTPDDTSGFFLRQADLDILSPAEATANANLIVPDGPPSEW